MSQAEKTLAVQLEQANIYFDREVRFHPERRWRADFVVPASMTDPFDGESVSSPFLIECDGGSWIMGRHSRGVGFEADLEKLNAAALLGFRVLRFTPSMISDGRALSVIRAALGLAEQAA